TTATPPRPDGMLARTEATSRATASAGASPGRTTYSTPAPADPCTTGSTPVSPAAEAIPSSTAASADTQNVTPSRAPPPASGEGTPPHQSGAVDAGAGICAIMPHDSTVVNAASLPDREVEPSSFLICSARAATPSAEPSRSTPMFHGASGAAR